MKKEQPYRFVISGGGTGGHIFPAIAIANGIREMYKTAEILFVGASDRMEMKKVPEAGYEIIGLNISGIKRSLTLSNLLFPFKLIKSILKSYAILKKFKPNVVIGVGGYASGPLLYAATKMKIPTLIQEQNSYAGLTNKWLANKVNTICVAYKGMERYFPKEKIIFSGNPVRQDILDISSKRQEALKFFQLTEDKKTILAIGGSLGARTINESLKLHVKKLADANVQVIWQTGSTHYESVKESLEKHNNKNIKAFEFLKNMDLAYAASDLVISRAGALAASELCIVKKPTIFVPSPNVAEDHQTKNANALVNENAAIMIHDNDAKKKLVESALTLLNDSDRMVSLSENIGELGMPQATKTIVDEVDKLIKRN